MTQPVSTSFPPPQVVDGFDFSELALWAARIKDRQNPLTAERANLWQVACDTFADSVREGREPREVKISIAAWLYKYIPAIAASESAALRNLERKLARIANGKSVADQRRNAAKARRAPKLSQADRDTIVGSAVFKHDGKLDTAWWQCVAGNKLSAELIARYPLPKNKAPRCPRAIRRQVSKEIARLLETHRSPRQAKLNGPYIRRNWEGVFAGDWFSSDDITLPVYYYIPDGKDWFTLTRGQFLPLIDVRSKRILDFVLIDGKSYNAAAVRSLINRSGSRCGLPRKGYHFERGIWASASLLGGGTALPFEQVKQNFADKLGLRVMHSLPGNARAKIVERVAGAFQDLLEGEHGYVGRNEMTIKYDRIQKAKLAVEARRQHPSEAGFYGAEQWFKRLHELCAEYNAKPQQSEVIGDYISPDEAMERLQFRNTAGAVVGLTKLPDELRYMLASQCVPVTVRRGRVRVSFSKFDYLVGGSSLYDGEILLAWFDPEQPETLCVTDYKKENVVCLPREILPDAYGATREEIRLAGAAMNEQLRHERARYSELAFKYMPPARANIADQAALEIGRRMESTKLETKTRPMPCAVEFNRAEPKAPKLTVEDRAQRLAELQEFEKANRELFQ